MLNFKNFILQDARSHSELNPKISINQRLKDYYNRAPKAPPHFGLEKNAWVSFTAKEKLGVNPNTLWDTPLGICSYSLDYAIGLIGDSKTPDYVIPYAGDEPYANCFSVKGNIININEFPSGEKYISELHDYCIDNFDIEEENLIDIWKKADYTAKNNTVGAIFWNRAKLVAYTVTNQRDYSRGFPKPKNIAVVWNSILRHLGIDGLIDNGAGVLHPRERTQSIFLHIGCIYNVERYDNKYSPEAIKGSIKNAKF